MVVRYSRLSGRSSRYCIVNFYNNFTVLYKNLVDYCRIIGVVLRGKICHRTCATI